MTAKTINITPKQWIEDIEPEALPIDALSGMDNLEYRDGVYRQAKPYAAALGAGIGASGPRYLLPNQLGESAYWVYPDDTGLYVTDGLAHSDITPAGLGDTGAITAPWTGGIVNQRPVINNRVYGPYWWDQNTLNAAQALPDWPVGDTCNAMRSFRGYLIAMNIVRSGTRIPDLLAWSDIAAPGDIPRDWTTSPTSQAGEVSVSFNPGGLVDGRQLLDRFFVYKTSSCYLLQLIGGQFIFSQRPVFASIGALSRNCIVEYRGTHIVLTNGDLVVHDGVTARSLVQERARRLIFDFMDGDNFENSYLTLCPSEGCLYVARPRAGEVYPSEMLSIDLNEGAGQIGRRTNAFISIPYAVNGVVDSSGQTFESTWASKTTQWSNDPTRWSDSAFLRTADFVVMADYGNNKFQQLGTGASYDGEQIIARATRRGLAFSEEQRKKRIGRVWLRATGTNGNKLLVSVGASDDPDAVPKWSEEKTFTLGTTKALNFDQDDVTGYYLSYRVRAVGQASWKLHSIRMKVHDMGFW